MVRRKSQVVAAACEPLEGRRLLSAVPEMVRDINADASVGSNPANLTPVGDVLFFTTSNTPSTFSLWKSDGTAGSAVRVKDLQANCLTNFNGTLYFFAGNTVGPDFDLWKSDGTAAGTVKVADLSASQYFE